MRPLSDVMRELLAAHPRPEEFRSELAAGNPYDAALQDVIDALEPIHDALYVYLCDTCGGSLKVPDPERPCPDCLVRPGFIVSRASLSLARAMLCLALRARGMVTVSSPADGSEYVVDDLIDAVLRAVLGAPDLQFSGVTTSLEEQSQAAFDRSPLGTVVVTGESLASARLDADHLKELLRKLAELEIMSEELREGEPTSIIAISRLGDVVAQEGETPCGA